MEIDRAQNKETTFFKKAEAVVGTLLIGLGAVSENIPILILGTILILKK